MLFAYAARWYKPVYSIIFRGNSKYYISYYGGGKAMQNFEFYNPTKIVFGKGSLARLREELSTVGKNILLVTGGSSVRKMGLYDSVRNVLKEAGCTVYEVTGVQPNPRLSSVRQGIELCKKHGIDFILAVGGGSVIDAAKGMAVGARTDIDIWDFYLQRQEVADALPLGTVLTLAATGTEMNGNSVVTNWETHEKLAIGSKHIYPRFSILDPEYTYSVPREHTVNGCIDIIIHVFEQYFSQTPETPLQDRFCESIIQTTIENTWKVIENPQDYDARANILWCGTLALNTLIGMGKEEDWATHGIEHEVSAIYDIAHGAGLAILAPHWMKHVMQEGTGKFKQYAERVWNVAAEGKTDEEIALEGIRKTREFFTAVGAPVSLSQVGIDERDIALMAEKAVRFGPIGGYKKLYKEDVEEILRESL